MPRTAAPTIVGFSLFLAGLVAGAHTAGAQPGTVLAEQKISDTAGGLPFSLNTNDQFGWQSTGIGDIDNDGVDDMAVGGAGGHKIWILMLNADGTVKSYYEHTAPATIAPIAGIGDFDGDTIEDIVVGNPDAAPAGEIQIWRLDTDGSKLQTILIANPSGVADGFGKSVGFLGDIDNNGVPDIGVGCPDWEANGPIPGAGRAYALLLNADASIKATNWVSSPTGGVMNGRFGSSIDGVGDVNGDGVRDMVVGMIGIDGSFGTAGYMFIHFLNSSGAQVNWNSISEYEVGLDTNLIGPDSWGISVRAIGDIDLDGITEIMTGAPLYTTVYNEGAAFVMSLNKDGSLKWSRRITTGENGFVGPLVPNDYFGTSIGFIGTLSGDTPTSCGAKVVVGCPEDMDGGSAKGAVFVLTLEGTCPAPAFNTTMQVPTERTDYLLKSSVTPPPATVLGSYDFEGCSVQSWTSEDLSGRGDFAQLYPGLTLLQEDLCVSNPTCVWTFFTGSTEYYGCHAPDPHPEQEVVAYVDGLSRYVHNEVWSPQLTWASTGSRVVLSFDAYLDLPLDNLVFYTWRVRTWVGATPGAWKSHDIHYLSPLRKWHHETLEIGDLVDPGATSIQVALGVQDLAGEWAGWLGSGACHSHAPLFDNVKVERLQSDGPAWFVSPVDLFQDNFPEDGTATGKVAANVARDTRHYADPRVRPGDSCVVWVGDADNGLATGVGGKDDVRIYVRVESPVMAKSGASLSGDVARWPHVGTISDGTYTWDIFQMDNAYEDDALTIIAPGRYCFDFDDVLFDAGDIVYYFFGATSAGTSLDSYWSEGHGTVSTITPMFEDPIEFTCLPRTAYTGGHILWIDQCDGWGEQQYLGSALDLLGISNLVDRYDVRAPSMTWATGLGSRVKDISQQIVGPYRNIIWSSGGLPLDVLKQGEQRSMTKADDFAPLAELMDNSLVDGGVFILGTDIATRWDLSSQPGAATLSSYLPFNLTSDSHFYYGFDLNPTIVGVGGGIFGIPDPDSMIVCTRCDQVGFDVLEPIAPSTSEMTYDGSVDPAESAVIASSTVNSHGSTMNAILAGFSTRHTCDIKPASAPYRATFLAKALNYLTNNIPVPTGAGETTQFQPTLAQNYPNPFNPSTAIRFVVARRGPVSLNVYDVAGRLVRKLVDVPDAGAGERVVTWDGRNNNGESVATGVYFYRLVTRSFTDTRKMVLLK